MKVLMFMISSRAKRAGGMEVVFHELAASLRKRGHKVDELYRESQAYRERGSHGETWGIPLSLPRSLHRVPTPLSILRSFLSLTRIAGVLSVSRPDVVYIHFIDPHAAYFVILKHLYRYRLVLSARGSDLLRPAGALPRTMLPFLLKHNDAIVVASEAVYDKVLSYGGNKERMVKIPNGVNMEFWSQPKSRPRSSVTPTVISVGRLERVKGTDVLVHSFAEVIQRIPEARLVVIGEGTLRPQLETIIAEQGIADRVELVGAMDRLAIRECLHEADVFAMPSRSEGFGLAALEAMAAGLPVVGSSVGGLPELTGEGGLLVPPEQPAALAEALTAVLTDRKLRYRIATAAARRAESFSWGRSADAYEKVLCG